MSLDWLELGISYRWLAVPLAITTISAVAQVVAKLRARKVLNQLRAELETARMRHRGLLTEYFLRQQFLCRQLQLSPPERPAPTLPQQAIEEEEQETLKTRLLKKVHWRRPKTTLTQGSTGSARVIVGRHSLSVGWSFIWRTTGTNIMRVVQPLGNIRAQAGYLRGRRRVHRGIPGRLDGSPGRGRRRLRGGLGNRAGPRRLDRIQ